MKIDDRMKKDLELRDYTLGALMTVSAFEGVFPSAADKRSILPPADNELIVNTDDYRKKFNTDPVLKWGVNNKFPTDILEEAMKCTVFESAMKIFCDHLYGQGFFFYREVFKNGERVIEEVDDPELMDYLYEVGYYEYYYAVSRELPHWANFFPMYYLNKKRDIVKLKLEDSPYCRLERPNWKTGKKENIYVSAQWPNGLDLKSPIIPDNWTGWVNKIPLLDNFNYVTELSLMRSKYTFAQHLKYHTTGFTYGRAPWHSLWLNRWLGISAGVPEMTVRLYEASMQIQYLVYMHENWIKMKFPDWETEGFDREAALKALQDSWDKNLKGKDKSFKSLMLSMFTNPNNGELVKSVMFEPMNNKLQKGDFIPDSQMADTQIIFAIGLPMAMIGLVQPGAKGGEAGSGSPIREASLSLNSRLRPDRDLMHTPFYVLRDYMFKGDKKRKGLKIGTRDYVINSLDGRAATSGKEATAV